MCLCNKDRAICWYRRWELILSNRLIYRITVSTLSFYDNFEIEVPLMLPTLQLPSSSIFFNGTSYETRMEKKRKQRKKLRRYWSIGFRRCSSRPHTHNRAYSHKLWFRTKMPYKRACVFDSIYEKQSRIISLYVSSMAQLFNIEHKITLEIIITYHGYLQSKNVISFMLDISSFDTLWTWSRFNWLDFQ